MSEDPAPTKKGSAALRTMFGVLLCLAAVAVMWIVRSSTLGFSPLTTTGIFALFLPAILLVWPSTTLKKNPIKALLPAAIAIGLIAAIQIFLGTKASDVLFSNGMGDPAPRSASLPLNILFYAAVGAAAYIIFFIPERKRRLKVIFNSLLTVAAVEGLFLGEEALFYKDRDRFDAVVQSTLGKSGVVPTNGYLRVAKVSTSNIAQADYAAAYDRKSYTLHWRRILSPGYTIAYSSKPTQVWITRESVR